MPAVELHIARGAICTLLSICTTKLKRTRVTRKAASIVSGFARLWERRDKERTVGDPHDI